MPDASLPLGWLADAEASRLAALASGRVVLEIGSFLGRSTIALARTAALVVSVDHHRGSAEHQVGASHYVGFVADPNDPARIDTAPAFLANLAGAGVRDNVIAIIGESAKVLPRLCPRTFDLAFIDAGHDYESVSFDARAAMSLVRHGRPIVFHDYNGFVGVTRAVDDISAVYGVPVRRMEGSLAVIVVPSRD